MTGDDDNTFTIRLKEPVPLLLDGFAKISSLVPFMMPERTAKTDPFQQITDTVGSGPSNSCARSSSQATRRFT
jgi:peptide/nickel transport system substrate-binding protein